MIYLPKLGRAKFLADRAGIEGVASIETGPTDVYLYEESCRLKIRCA